MFTRGCHVLLCGVQYNQAQSDTKRVNQRLMEALQDQTRAMEEREAADARAAQLEAQLRDEKVRKCVTVAVGHVTRHCTALLLEVLSLPAPQFPYCSAL
jgi:predicted Holliday junction resolvase-like endonuclease